MNVIITFLHDAWAGTLCQCLWAEMTKAECAEASTPVWSLVHASLWLLLIYKVWWWLHMELSNKVHCYTWMGFTVHNLYFHVEKTIIIYWTAANNLQRLWQRCTESRNWCWTVITGRGALQHVQLCHTFLDGGIIIMSSESVELEVSVWFKLYKYCGITKLGKFQFLSLLLTLYLSLPLSPFSFFLSFSFSAFLFFLSFSVTHPLSTSLSCILVLFISPCFCLMLSLSNA